MSSSSPAGWRPSAQTNFTSCYRSLSSSSPTMSQAYTMVHNPKFHSNVTGSSSSPLKLSGSHGQVSQLGRTQGSPNDTHLSDEQGQRNRKYELNGSHSSKKRKIITMNDDEDDRNVPHLVNGMNGQQKGSKDLCSHRKVISLLEQRKALPIWEGREKLVKEIRENNTVVILGETGTGKTTQVPQFLFEAGFANTGAIACTQPRRVAATSLAERVAAEQNVPLGSRVGYSVRFEEKCSRETKIKYLTDGMLVRELLSDPMLSKYSVVIIDEAHERTLRTDFMLASLKSIQKTRTAKQGMKPHKLNPLKVVIMSATLDAERFSHYYNNAKILNIKGRQHPVKILYTKASQEDFCEAALKTFFQIHTTENRGDVLIFLPGQDDIESLEQSIRMYAKELPQDKMQVIVCPMYASLASHLQAKVFHPTPAKYRKCILATNIAETSITIPGIKYVIDTGLCKEKSYIARDRGSAIDSLLIQPISKSSAMQRAGRAGRMGEGYCYRLYTEAAYNRLRDGTIPEIQRCNLASSILELKCLGQNPEEVDFMDAPDPNYIKISLFNLYGLGALDSSGVITPIGRHMAMLPLEPSAARAVLAAQENGCVSEVLLILSVTSASSKLFLDSFETRDLAQEVHQKFVHPSGDHMTYLNVIRTYNDIAQQESTAERKAWCRTHFVNERTIREAGDIFEQLKRICTSMDIDWRSSCGNAVEPILRSLVRGLYLNVAFLHPDGQYKQIHGQMVVKIHPSSCLSNRKVPCLFFEELVFTTQTYARVVSSIPLSVIAELSAFHIRSA